MRFKERNLCATKFGGNRPRIAAAIMLTTCEWFIFLGYGNLKMNVLSGSTIKIIHET